jgi:hypothetical protein
MKGCPETTRGWQELALKQQFIDYWRIAFGKEQQSRMIFHRFAHEHGQAALIFRRCSSNR